MMFTNPDSPFASGIAMVNTSGAVHPDWNGGAAGFARELFDHEGGFLFTTGESLAKCTYEGLSWFNETGDTWGDYYLTGEWGSGFNNPYEVRWTWDIFILEDQSVLIGGAIATDTLQPSLFRHLMRLFPDGSHDDTFPIIEAIPQGLNTHISKIERASDGSWYVSGRFQGINGHISPHIAHLTADFEVDTDFVSPFVYESVCCGLHNEMKLLDSQDRMWFSGFRVRLEENPDDTLHLVRLLPNGSVDPDFQVGRIESQYPFGWEDVPIIVKGICESQSEENVFYIYGAFSHYNDTAQPCVSALNDAGFIQENYFMNQGATANDYDPDDPTEKRHPSVKAMEILEDGSLMLGGAFSDFMGVERYSMVKLNQGTVGTSDQNRLVEKLKVYPNPASIYLHWDKQAEEVELYDMLGKRVLQKQITDLKNELLLDGISPGLYSIVFHTTDGIAIQKLVIQ